MATLEELTVEATSEIEAAKPLYKQVNNERMEFDDSDYDQAITDEEFKTFYEIPNGDHVKFFDNKTNSKNSNFSNIADYIDAVLSKDISNAKKLYPQIWYRDSDELIKLTNLRNNLNKNKNITLLKSKSWIQTIPELKSDRFLIYIDHEEDIGFLIKFYKKRFMHVELDAFLKDKKISKYLNVKQRVFNEEVYLFDHPFFGVILSIEEI